MRILFVTNFYPPHELGGQGRSCQQVVHGLQARGHETAVLTSMHGVNNSPVQEDGVYRHLYLEMDFVPWRQSVTFFTDRRRRERVNVQRIDDVLRTFAPDVTFIWGMWNLPRSVPRRFEKRAPEAAVLYRFADYWPTLPSQHELYWRQEGRTLYSRLPKRLVARVALRMLQSERREGDLQFPNSICVSAATRDHLLQAGVPMDNAVIVHNGIDLARYNGHVPTGDRAAGPLNLLYAGRLHPTKGVDTAIEALAHLLQQGRSAEWPSAVGGHTNVHLSIAGSGDQTHVTRFKGLAADISDHVTFLGQVPHEAMPAVLRRHHVLLLPSRWPEPFARTPLEAMASGLVVVATPLGGTSELIDDGVNGLLFPPGDAAALAQKLIQLLENPPLRTTLAQAAYTRVAQEFTLETMLDKIEAVLQHTVASSKPVRVPS